MGCSMFEVRSIVGFFFNFCCWLVCCNDFCSLFVRFGFMLVLFLLFVWSDWCNICFNFGVKVMIGIFFVFWVIFWIIKCLRVICIVDIKILGFWLCVLYLLSVCMIVCILWIGMFLNNKVCSIFMMVFSGRMFGINFLISFGCCLVSILRSCCVFLCFNNWYVLLESNWFKWVVIMVVVFIIVYLRVCVCFCLLGLIYIVFKLNVGFLVVCFFNLLNICFGLIVSFLLWLMMELFIVMFSIVMV